MKSLFLCLWYVIVILFQMEVIDSSAENVLPLLLDATSDATTKMDTEDKKEDLYSYTRLKDFTSEIFKIELCNLPTFVGYGVSCLKYFSLYF